MARDSAKRHRLKVSPLVRSGFAVHEYCRANGTSRARTSWREECARSAYPSAAQTSLRNAQPDMECPHDVRAAAAGEQETHSDDNKGRYEIRPPSPSPSDHGG